ncbi:MAG: DUF2723 domain-containing protein [Acidobacteriota bacterium]
MSGNQSGEVSNLNQPDNGSFPGKIRRFLPWLIFILSLPLYLFTLAPTVTLVDSGELILAAKTLGIAHPPGFPLYALLAHFFTYLPVGNLAVRVHFLSALCAATAAALMSLLVYITLNTPAEKPGSKNKNKSAKKPKAATRSTKTETPDSSTGVIASAIIASLMFAFSRTLWAYATLAEVYTLNACLSVLIIFLMMRWRREVIETRNRKQPLTGKDKSLYFAAFIFGMALGVHHVTIALLLPALALLVFKTAGFAFFKSKRLLIAALISVAGLSIYLYLPLAASRSPLMNWGDPRTFETFWWHITGRQYQVFFDFSPARVSEFFKLLWREFNPNGLPLGVGLGLSGLLALFRRDRTLFYFLLLIISADVIYCLGYEIDEDKDAYYLPAFIAFTIAIGFGVRWLFEFLHSLSALRILTPLRLSVALLLIPLVTLAGNFAYNNRSQYFIASDYVDNALQTIEPNGLLLTEDWQLYSPMLYALEIEKRRPDVISIDINQLRRSWYFDYLNQVYPDLMNPSRNEVNEFLEDLRSWERDPDRYAKNPELTRRINERFYAMILAFVSRHLAKAPVYVTLEIGANQGGVNAELTKALNEKYKLIPQGLLFRVNQELTLPEKALSQLQTRGLNDGSLKFENDDVVKKKVFPVYVAMFINNSRYWAFQNRHDQAIEWLKKALELEPDNQFAKNLLAASQSALQKPTQQ